MDKENVLIITRNFPSTICGVGDYTNELLKRIPQAKVCPFVLTSKQKPVQEFVILNGLENQVFFFTSPFLPSLYRQILVICKEYKISQVLWQYVPYSYSRRGIPFYVIPLILLLRLRKLKNIIYFHEISVRAWGYGFKQLCLALCQQFIGRTLALIAHKSVTSIDFYKKFLWPSNALVIPVGANIYNTQEYKKKDYDNDIPYIFCFANRVDKVLLKSILELNRDAVVIKLIIAGFCTTETENFLKREIKVLKIEELVCWNGILSKDELATLIMGSDIYFQPQTLIKKNHGGVSAKNGTIIAAMGMAKAIIATKGDMTDEILFIHGENVHFVRPGDLNDYVDAITSITADSEYKVKLEYSALKTYNQYFSWEVIAASLAKILIDN